LKQCLYQLDHKNTPPLLMKAIKAKAFRALPRTALEKHVDVELPSKSLADVIGYKLVWV